MMRVHLDARDHTGTVVWTTDVDVGYADIRGLADAAVTLRRVADKAEGVDHGRVSPKMNAIAVALGVASTQPNAPVAIDATWEVWVERYGSAE